MLVNVIKHHITSAVRSFTFNMASLSYIPPIEQVSDRIIRVLGLNPGPFTLQGTNCYLVGTGSKRILIDTGIKDQENFIENLKGVLAANKVKLQAIIITHWHKDHCGGVPNICDEILKSSDIAVYKFPRISSPEDKLGDNIDYTYVEDGHVFKTEGATLRAVYTPGHADDHMSLMFEEENAMFTGDTVLGEGTSVFEDLYDYLKSLELIRSHNASVLYPAHGAVVKNPQEHLTTYITHRLMREQQIIQAMESNSDAPITIPNIVNIVYKDLPENLVVGAMNNVKHHLTKLIKDKRVLCTETEDGTAYGLSQSHL